MRQQVNLFADEFKRKREALTLRQLLVLWGGFVGLLTLASSWQGVDVWQLTREETHKQLQWRQLSQDNEALRASYTSQPDPQLITEVETLRRLYQNQELLVDSVQGYERVSELGFSRYLADLATGHVDGLALSRITLRDGGARIHLQGETNAPVNVPVFLKRLSRGDSFRGHRFDQFQLEEQASGVLRFDINGPAEERSG